MSIGVMIAIFLALVMLWYGGGHRRIDVSEALISLCCVLGVIEK